MRNRTFLAEELDPFQKDLQLSARSPQEQLERTARAVRVRAAEAGKIARENANKKKKDRS